MDALDLAPLLVGRPHVVAHSYGVLGTLTAAAAAPGSVRSLTLIEPPLNYLPDDLEVARLGRIGDAVLTHGMDVDPTELREFLHLAGTPIGDGPLPEDVVASVRRAHGGRPTSEARPRLDTIRDAGVPVLVASGDHAAALERICDALADALGGTRSVHPGAGHFVAAAPGFAEQLETFPSQERHVVRFFQLILRRGEACSTWWRTGHTPAIHRPYVTGCSRYADRHPCLWGGATRWQINSDCCCVGYETKRD